MYNVPIENQTKPSLKKSQILSRCVVLTSPLKLITVYRRYLISDHWIWATIETKTKQKATYWGTEVFQKVGGPGGQKPRGPKILSPALTDNHELATYSTVYETWVLSEEDRNRKKCHFCICVKTLMLCQHDQEISLWHYFLPCFVLMSGKCTIMTGQFKTKWRSISSSSFI